MELQAEQERRLWRIGIEPETRKYTPHVTLARLRGAGQAAIASYLAERGALIATRSSPSASSSIPPARGRAADPTLLRPPIRWAKDRHRRSRLRLARTPRYRDASHFHGLEAL